MSRVPSTPDPSGFSVVLDQAEFERIRQGAKVFTDADKRELKETTKAAKNSKLDASNARKSEMQELEIQRKKNEKPSDLEQVCSPVVVHILPSTCMCVNPCVDISAAS